jgi:hypothetical protein
MPAAQDADALFREGAALFAAGKVRLACPKFIASFKLDPAPGTLKNLALCHVAEGKTASAWREYLRLTSLAGAAGVKKAEQEARAQAAALEKKLSRVTFTLPDTVTLKSLKIDDSDVDLADLHAPLPLDPGPHELHLVDNEGREVRVTANVSTSPGVTAILVAWPSPSNVSAAPVVRAAGPPPPPEKKVETGPLRPLGWSLLGLGAVGIIVGSGCGLAANADRNDHPNNDAFHVATVSTVAFAVGLASAAVGGYLVWESRAKVTVGVMPIAGLHAGGLAAQGAW